MSTDKIKVNLYMDPKLLRVLKKLAALEDRPYADLIRSACRQYVLQNAHRITDEQQVIRLAGDEAVTAARASPAFSLSSVSGPREPDGDPP